MYLLPHDDWMRLARHAGEPCVTLLQPLFPAEQDRDRVRIALKNAVDAADQRLATLGLSPDRRSALLEPLRYDGRNADVPRDGETLLACLSPSLSEVHILEAALSPRLEVTRHLVLSDLRAALTQPDRWYLLTLTDDAARLLEVVHGTPIERPLPLERPDRDAANAERAEPHGPGRHAHGTSQGLSPQGFGNRQVDDIERTTWYEVVDDALRKVLPDPAVPLVVVADVVHHDAFAEVCHVHQVIALDHQPDGLSDGELRDMGAEHLERVSASELESLRDAWFAADATTTKVDQALEAARNGRIDTLLWVPDAEVRHVDDQADAPDGAPDLVDEVVRQTVLHGGRTVPVRPDTLPAPEGHAAVNAILRW
jgi:hypothetical protein